VDIFERIESFFRRLDIYVNVPPTPEMMDIIMQIMVEVLLILGIATKEMKQGRTSEYSLSNVPWLTEGCSEKYMKKLVGRTDMEDSLKRLDKLTQEEARIAMAEVLKITHTVEKGVRGIADKVVGVDDRVANINNSVAGVDHRVADVDNRVACVDDRVRTVDNKVAVVIEGAQITSRLSSKRLLIPCWPDGKQARVAMQQAANDVDEMKRWSSPNCIYFICVGLNRSYREPITTRPSTMAFPTGSLDQSQHCV